MTPDINPKAVKRVSAALYCGVLKKVDRWEGQIGLWLSVLVVMIGWGLHLFVLGRLRVVAGQN